MSSPLKQNTTALQELLDKINQLPEAGNSGGGGSIVSLFGSSATGMIPNYGRGYATTELNVTFTTSATGANS